MGKKNIVSLVKRKPKEKIEKPKEKEPENIQRKKSVEDLYLEKQEQLKNNQKTDYSLNLEEEEKLYNKRSSWKDEEPLKLFNGNKSYNHRTEVLVNPVRKPLTGIKKISHQKKIHIRDKDISALIRNEKIPDIFTLMREPDLRAFKKALSNIKPGDEEFEKSLVSYRVIELLKFFSIMKTPELLEKYPIFKKYKLTVEEQKIAVAIRLLLDATKYLKFEEEYLYQFVFVKSKARLKYSKFFEDVLDIWHEAMELVDDRENLEDSEVYNSRGEIKFSTIDTLLSVNTAVRAGLIKFLKSSKKIEKERGSLKHSTIKLVAMTKRFSLRYLNSFSNLDWDLSLARYKIIRNTLSKEKTIKFLKVVSTELLKLDAADFDNKLLEELQSALNSGQTLLNIIREK